MRVLVTGGAGYIGSHTCKALADNGHLPITLDNLDRGHRWAVRYGPLEQVDLQDRSGLEELFRRHSIDAVLHFAAFALVGESVGQPGLYYRNNFVGSLNLVEAMVKAGVPCLVFSSTCATYGIPETSTLSEESPQRPINPYGHSKLMVERMLADMVAAHPLKAVCLRYFNACGADADGEIGEDHDPETHLIPNIMYAALGKSPKLKVFGDDYPTADGTCVRDYIHVTDLASAHLCALEKLTAGQSLRPAYNLGTGQGFSNRQIIEGVEQVTGRTVPRGFCPRRPGDPPSLVADASLAARELGWRPAHSDLPTIVETAWRWHLKHHGDAFPGQTS